MLKIIPLFIFLVVPFAQADITRLGDLAVGSVQLAPGSTMENDFVVAIFSDHLVQDPVLENMGYSLPVSKQVPLEGCFSVVRLSLHSGNLILNKPATLTFGCDGVDPDAEVYGWINNTWIQVPSSRDENGQLHATIETVTTYVIFPHAPNPNITDYHLF